MSKNATQIEVGAVHKKGGSRCALVANSLAEVDQDREAGVCTPISPIIAQRTL